MNKLIPLLVFILVVYLGVKLIPPWYSQTSLESSIEKILAEYDGYSVIDMDESDLIELYVENYCEQQAKRLSR